MLRVKNHPLPVTRDANNRLIGESHPRAELTDYECVRIRHMRNSQPEVWSWAKLAQVWETPQRTIRDICEGRTRNSSAEPWPDDDR